MKNQQKNTKNYSCFFVLLKRLHFGNLYLKSDMMAYKNITDSTKETPLRDSAQFSTPKRKTQKKLSTTEPLPDKPWQNVTTIARVRMQFPRPRRALVTAWQCVCADLLAQLGRPEMYAVSHRNQALWRYLDISLHLDICGTSMGTHRLKAGPLIFTINNVLGYSHHFHFVGKPASFRAMPLELGVHTKDHRNASESCRSSEQESSILKPNHSEDMKN